MTRALQQRWLWRAALVRHSPQKQDTILSPLNCSPTFYGQDPRDYKQLKPHLNHTNNPLKEEAQYNLRAVTEDKWKSDRRSWSQGRA